jgi:hypothetical protein
MTRTELIEPGGGRDATVVPAASPVVESTVAERDVLSSEAVMSHGC